MENVETLENLDILENLENLDFENLEVQFRFPYQFVKPRKLGRRRRSWQQSTPARPHFFRAGIRPPVRRRPEAGARGPGRRRPAPPESNGSQELFEAQPAHQDKHHTAQG